MSDTARDALQRSISCRLLPLSHDELRVLDWVLIGLEKGVEPYGRMDVSKDRRDFRAEAAQEFRDAFVYLAGDFIARVARRQERVKEFADAFDDEQPTREFSRAGTSEQPPSSASPIQEQECKSWDCYCDAGAKSAYRVSAAPADASPGVSTLARVDQSPTAGAALSLEVGGESVLVPPVSDAATFDVRDGVAWEILPAGRVEP